MSSSPHFDSEQLCQMLNDLPAEALDELPFGVIGFDAEHTVVRYNRHESQAAKFPVSEVLGQQVFVELAPCLNNYIVALRFEVAAQQSQPLDAVVPYVLTFAMRPTRVRLRLLSDPALALRFVLVQRQVSGLV